MHAFFQLLAKEPFVPLFLCLGAGHIIGRIRVRGFTLGTTASSLLIALILSGAASEMDGVHFNIPDLVQTASLSLFLYAVGLRVGPQFIAGIRQEGIHLVVLTMITATLNFLIVWAGSLYFQIPPGFSAGMISGGYNVTAAMGVATRTVQEGAYQIPAGYTSEQVVANIAAGYSLTYVFSLLGIVLLITRLPRMFGIDPVAAARESAKNFGGTSDPAPGTSQAFQHGMLHGDIRVFQLASPQFAGHPVYEVFQRLDTPVLRLTRSGSAVPLKDNPVLQMGDLLTVGGPLKKLLADVEELGPEVDDEKARLIDLDQAEIVLTKPDFEGKTLRELHQSLPAYGIRLRAWFRSGAELPLLPDARLHRNDVLRVIGPPQSVSRAIEALGKGVRPTDVSDVTTLALGAALGYLIGLVSVTVGGIPFSLGTPAGVIVAGITVATLRTFNPAFGGPVTEGARSFLEDAGLDLFVTGLGLNVAPALLNSLSEGRNVVLVLLVGMAGALLPPFISWLVGLYVFKMDPILLAGAVAGSRSSTTAMRAMCEESQSSVPAFGYPVPYALSAVVVLIYGYLAMVLS
jgi:putative transport protein